MITKEIVTSELKKYNLFDNISQKDRIGLLSVNRRLTKDSKREVGLTANILKHLYILNIVDIYNYFFKIIDFLNKKLNNTQSSSSSNSRSSSSRSSGSLSSLSSIANSNSPVNVGSVNSLSSKTIKYKNNKIDVEKISKRKFNTIIDFVIYLLNKNIGFYKFKLAFKGINRKYYVIEMYDLKKDSKFYLIFSYKYHFTDLNFYQKLIWDYKNIYRNKTSVKNYIKRKFRLYDDRSYSPLKSPSPSPNLLSSLSKSIKSDTVKEIIRRNLNKYEITDDLLEVILLEFYKIIKPIFSLNVYNNSIHFIMPRHIPIARFKNMMKLLIEILNETISSSRYSIQSLGTSKTNCVIKVDYNGKTKYIIITAYNIHEGTEIKIYYYKKSLADVDKILNP